MELHEAVRRVYQMTVAPSGDKERLGGIIEELRTYSIDELASIACDLDRPTEDIFYTSALAHCVVSICRPSFLPSALVRHCQRWGRICVLTGFYQDCVHLVDTYVHSEFASRRTRQPADVSLLLAKAKAQRNLGEFESAVGTYRTAMQIAIDNRLPADVAISFLLMGKLYGNYLGQRGLFAAFVQEALERLENASHDSKDQRIQRYVAICHDALGQAFRTSDPERAEREFYEALRLNERIQNTNGQCRSLCHLHYHRFFRARETNHRIQHLSYFQDGLRLLKRDDSEERGLGIRWVQYARMLASLGKKRDALECLSMGQSIAAQYSDYRTIARASVVEGQLYADDDPALAVQILERGRDVARKRKLLIEESAINLELAKVGSKSVVHGTDSYVLFERNRQIFLFLVSEAKAALIRLNSSGTPELERISVKTRAALRENLILDFEAAVLNFDENIAQVTRALQATERRRQNLLVLGVVNSVAREMLHDLKIALPDGHVGPLQSTPDALTNLGREIEVFSDTASFSIADREKLKNIKRRLEDYAYRIRAVGAELTGLKTFLSRGLRRPRTLDQWVSIKEACLQAIREISERASIESLASPIFSCDLQVLLSQELMVTVIRNLLQNAFDARPDDRTQSIRLHLARSTEQERNTRDTLVSLSIITDYHDEERAIHAAYGIGKALEGRTTTKPFGSGLGIELARTVFADLMGATVQPVRLATNAGIEIVFLASADRCRITVAGERVDR